MSRAATQPQGVTKRAIKLVALPSEHGGWGFMLEPVLLGLLVAPSVAGVWLALATLSAFLVRQPLKLALGDRRASRRYPRTRWAERFALGYALLAAVAFALAAVAARGPLWLPVLMAVPLALLQAYYDMVRQGRQLQAELAGAVAMGAAVSAITLADGWAAGPALALWAFVAVRSVTSIIYVRARLRLEKGEAVDRMPTLATNGLGIALVVALAVAGALPWLAVVGVLALAARAFLGLSAWRRPARAQVIGFQEMGFGLLAVVLAAAGYALRL